MLVQILSPEQTLFDGEQIEKLILPAKGGYLEILKNHAPLITQLTKGEISLSTSNDNKKILITKGGLAKVENNKVLVLLEN